MPIVYAYLPNGKNSVSHYKLRRFCEQMIPAALNSAEDPLRPGNIIFIHSFVDMLPGACAMIVIKAQYDTDRDNRLDKVADIIGSYLKKYFGPVPFTVCVELITAGWSFAASEAQPFDGDMSLEAAYERLRAG